MLVVVFHVTGAANRGTPGGAFVDWTWGNGLVRFGNLGVALFFVLSGFLLSRPFFANHLAGERPPDLGRYTLRRFARIVPAYWVVLTVYSFLIREGPRLDAATYARFYLFLQIYDHRTIEGGGALAVAWTLCIEVTFYLVLPGLAWVLCRVAGQGPVAHRARVLALSSAALFVSGALVRWWMWETGQVTARRSYTLLGHFGWFGAGMALAAVVAGVAAGVAPPRWMRDLASLPALCLALAAGVAWLTTLLPLPAPVQRPNHQLVIFVGNGLVGALCLLPLVIGDQAQGGLRQVLASPPARWLGEVSYGLYLWHTPVLAVVNRWVDDGAMPSGTPVRLVVVTVVSLAAAHLSWTLLERPILRWANRR